LSVPFLPSFSPSLIPFSLSLIPFSPSLIPFPKFFSFPFRLLTYLTSFLPSLPPSFLLFFPSFRPSVRLSVGLPSFRLSFLPAFLPQATSLYVAAQNGHTAIVDILVEAGADRTKTFNMATPLAVAQIRGHHDCVELLAD
jgi:hypothetical protein